MGALAADATVEERLGPSSLLWRYAGDTRIAFLGGTIGLLQLMHPAIAAGVLEHSNFFEDPADRVFRSLPRILGAVYDGDAAAETGLQVRDFHRSIRGVDPVGRRYHALDPATFWWAHATFQFMAEQVVDRFDRHRLTDAEREQLYQEGVAWYRRYGVSERPVPADRMAFQAEWDRICTEVLEMNDAVRFVLDTLHAPLPPMRDRAAMPSLLRPVADHPVVRRLLARPSRIAAIGGLPASVRERFDIRWTAADQVQLDVIERTVALTWRRLPPTVRWQPRAYEGWQRELGVAP
ncbi:MAG: DUF2236 domain-containing protein [Acidimicrobiia bacterium]|nr:DUF2236 domain-containing protein [Acidimicrobiia bacterium]